MGKQDEILKDHLSEQIALEEHLFKTIEDQISDIEGDDFSDARDLLKSTSKTLEKHFTPLNQLLDTLEKDALLVRMGSIAKNGDARAHTLNSEKQKRQISKILRDIYSALNLITMSNTLLHTTALALEYDEVAKMALEHLENLAPLVVKIGELIPEIVARELYAESSGINLAIAKTALLNTQRAWRIVD